MASVGHMHPVPLTRSRYRSAKNNRGCLLCCICSTTNVWLALQRGELSSFKEFSCHKIGDGKTTFAIYLISLILTQEGRPFLACQIGEIYAMSG